MSTTTEALLDPAELEAWRGMLRVTVRARAELGRRLAAEHELTMAEYDTLVPLASAPGGRVRMADLAEEILQPRSSLTRLVDGLERRGYVRRESSPEDGRGAYAVLTALGRRRHTAAQRSHHHHIRELVTSRLSTRQLTQLANAWQAIGEHPEKGEPS